MPLAETIEKPLITRQSALRRDDAVCQVVDLVSDLCSTFGVGTRIPSHRDLMKRFDVSERTMLRALDLLRQSGRIERRAGSGTYVAHCDEAGTKLAVKRRTIVAVSQADRNYYDRCMNLLFDHATSTDLDLVCRMISSSNQVDIASIYPGPSLGFIVLSSKLSSLADQLSKNGHRVVLVGATFVENQCAYSIVQSDDELAGYLAAKHLIHLGHSRLAYVHSAADSSESPRLRGLLRAVSECSVSRRLVEVSLPNQTQIESWDSNDLALRNFFCQRLSPTGIVVWNDCEAYKLIDQLRRISVNVPSDVSIVGHDAFSRSNSGGLKLTTVDGSVATQLEAALSILTNSSPLPVGSRIVIPPAFIAGESTASPRE